MENQPQNTACELFPLSESTKLIRGWVHARNIILGATSAAQFLKLTEEWKEIFDGIELNDEAMMMDAVGDSYVVLTIIAAQHNIDLEQLIFSPTKTVNAGIGHLGKLAHNLAKGRIIVEPLTECLCFLDGICLMYGFGLPESVSLAYAEIKDRKGRVIDGVFVKEADLPA